MQTRLSLVFILFLIQTSRAELLKRFEYKHSFKGPHLVQKDRSVPFWTYIGSKFLLFVIRHSWYLGPGWCQWTSGVAVACGVLELGVAHFYSCCRHNHPDSSFTQCLFDFFRLTETMCEF